MGHPIGKSSIFIVCVLCAALSATDSTAVQSRGSSDTTDQKQKQSESSEQKAPSASADSPEEAGTYSVRLRDLEDRINRLKEQIFRSKARLSLLAETVLDRKIAGGKATILFQNEMGSAFKLVKATFLLDGGPIFNKTDENGSLSEAKMLSLYDGPVVPGDHTLSVVLQYQGHGYGVFSYLKGYTFRTRSSRTITVGEGKAVELTVVAYEKGGVTTPLEERPDVRYLEAERELVGEEPSSNGSAR